MTHVGPRNQIKCLRVINGLTQPRYSSIVAILLMYKIIKMCHEKYAKTKMQISCKVTVQLISAFIFATLLLQSLFFLNPKFQASSHLLWPYSLVCVRPGWKPPKTGSLDVVCIRQLSHVVRKPAFCICENKDADQLRGNREADQRLCFRYTDSTISLLAKYEISSLQRSSLAEQPGLCGTWLETPKTGFLRTRLNYAYWRDT